MMKLKTTMAAMALSMACVSQQAAAANPASTDYVQNYVQNILAESTLFSRIGTAVPGGVVFFTNSTKTHGMIVADIDSSVESPTGLMPFTCDTPQRHLFTSPTRQSGVGNTAAIIAYVLQSPASCQFAAAQANQFAVNTDDPSVKCSNSLQSNCLGGWTLPSAADLEILMANLDVVNASITANGGEALSGRYWTSSLNNGDYSKAYAINAEQNAVATPTDPTLTLNRVRLVRYY